MNKEVTRTKYLEEKKKLSAKNEEGIKETRNGEG